MGAVIIFLGVTSFVSNKANQTLQRNMEKQKSELAKLQAEQNNLTQEKEKLKQEIKQQNKTIEEQKKKLEAKAKIKTRVAGATNVRPVQNGCEAYRGLISQYDWNVDQALTICQKESGGNTNALSRTADRGLFQVNQVHRAKVNGNLDALFIPATNVKIAYQIYSNAGRSWRPWMCCPFLW